MPEDWNNYYCVAGSDGEGDWGPKKTVKLNVKVTSVFPTSGIQGDQMQLMVNTLGQPPLVEYAWTFPQGATTPSTSDAANPLVTLVGEPGIYPGGSVTVENQLGATDTYNFSITIRPAVGPVIEWVLFDTPSPYTGQAASFSCNAYGTQTPLTYEWDFGGGATPATSGQQNGTVTLGDPGEYSGTLTVTDAIQHVDQMPFSYEVSGPPEVLAVEPLHVASNAENVTFTAYVDTGSGPDHTYEWDFDGGASPSSPAGTIDGPGELATATVTLGSLGLYNCSLYAENEFGSDYEEFTLTVGTPPSINSISPTSGDSGDEVEFTADVDGSATLFYVWNFGGAADPNISTDSSPTVTLQHGGNIIAGSKVYTVSLTVSNSLGSDYLQVEFLIDAQWHIDEVDSTSSVPLGYTSLEFLSDGTPTVVYQRDDSLYYAEKDSGSWSTEEVQGDSGSGNWASHEIDSSGNIHIVNYNADDDCLYYIVGTSGDWEDPVEVPDDQNDDFGQYCDIALNSNGEPGISFHNLSELTLMYATYDGQDWTVERVEPDSQPQPGYYGEYTSIKFKSNGVPCISYSGLINSSPATRRLKYAYRTGGNPLWEREFAQSADFGGYYSSLEFDSNDVPIIMHRITDS